MLDEPRERVLSMAVGPAALYRVNIFRPPPTPRPRSIDCPVQIIIPVNDPFVSEASYAAFGEYANNLTYKRVDASHWAPRSHRNTVTDLIGNFAAEHLN